MFLNESYIVTARCVSFRRTSFKKVYGVWSEGALKVEGSAVIVMTDTAGTTKVPLSEDMRAVLRDRDGTVAGRLETAGGAVQGEGEGGDGAVAEG